MIQASDISSPYISILLTSIGGATPPPISFYPGSASGSGKLDPRVDSAPRNEPSLRMVNHSSHQSDSSTYGRKGAGAQQQFLPSADNQRMSHNYGQASREPIPKPRSHGDFKPTRSQPPAIQNSSKKGSGGLTQGYDEALRSLVSDPRSSGGFRDVDESKATKRGSISRKPVGTSGWASSPSRTTTSPGSANYQEPISADAPPPVPKHDSYSRDPNVPRSLPQRSSHPQGLDYATTTSNPRSDNLVQQQKFQDPSAVPQGLNFARGTTTQRNNNSPSPAPPLFPRAQPPSSTTGPMSAAQNIVDRAKTNTKDTEVIERIAPGKPPSLPTFPKKKTLTPPLQP